MYLLVGKRIFPAIIVQMILGFEFSRLLEASSFFNSCHLIKGCIYILRSTTYKVKPLVIKLYEKLVNKRINFKEF